MIAPWFGSKGGLSRWIVPYFGEHAEYWELFCGSMAVLMAKPVCLKEYANDMHWDLTNLARVIQDPVAGPRFYRRVRRTLVCDGILADSSAIITGSCLLGDGPDVERAYHYFVVSWMGRRGLAGTVEEQKTQERGTIDYSRKDNGTVRWRSCVQSIPQWHRRLANVAILNRDAFEIVDKIIDRPGTVIYADPPYFEAGNKYSHAFAENSHERLVGALSRFKHAMVVVSYYEHPEVLALWPEAQWVHLRRRVNKNLSHVTGQTSHATEMLLINRSAFVMQPTLFD